jgi:hypothetical protein
VVQGKFNNQVIFYMEVELENGGGVNLILKHLVIVILNVFFLCLGVDHITSQCPNKKAIILHDHG